MPKSDRPAFLKIYNKTEHAAISGWKEVGDGSVTRAFVNPNVGLLEQWVTVMRSEGEGGETPCYEQPKIFENQVVVVIIEDEQGRIVFAKGFRQIGHRIPGIPATQYVQRLQQNPDLIRRSLDLLGMWQWELPLGLVTSHDPGHLSMTDEEIVFDCARLEAREEAGCEIDNLTFVGWFHMELAYVPYPCAVVRARLRSQGAQRPEANEFLDEVQWFSPAEIRARIDDGSLGSGVILGALLMAGIQIPPSTPR